MAGSGGNVASMNLMTWLTSMWRGHDKRPMDDGMAAQPPGGQNLEMTPGLEREIETTAGEGEDGAEHEEPQ